MTGADPRQDAALVGWESSVNTRSSNHDAGRDDYYFVHSAFASSTYEPVAGSYAVYLPAVDASGAAITDCGSHYGTVAWEIPDDDDAAPSRVPPRRLPGGLLEDAIACVPGQMVTAEFSLEGSPDAPTLIPLQRSAPVVEAFPVASPSAPHQDLLVVLATGEVWIAPGPLLGGTYLTPEP